MENFDINSWINQLVTALEEAFGKRLRFVGLQGSRARGEAKVTSDIDSVVVVERLSTEDIELYSKLIDSMPHSELACGFIGSPDVLRKWPRHDIFNLVMDTLPMKGSLDFVSEEFSAEDALLSAKVGASEIYHALNHALAFDRSALHPTLEACLKSTFFVMRALVFANTGEYPNSRTRMKELASPVELALLEAYDNPCTGDAKAIIRDLLKWSEDVITSS